MATERGQPNGGIDHDAYNAAMRPGTKLEIPQFKEVLNGTTTGSRNTLLHVAASVGNLKVVEELLKLNPLLVKATNGQRNTPLHLAAQGGLSKVVEILLRQQDNAVDLCNNCNETALFKAYESGDSTTVIQLLRASPLSALNQKTVRGRTCLYVAIVKGNSELLTNILKSRDAKELIKVKYENGDTALHVASGKNYVHIMRQLIKLEPELCCWVNNSGETPLCVAAKLGHLEAVRELMKGKAEAVEIRNSRGMNVLHLAAHVSQVRIVEYLNETVGLLDLVNQGVDNLPVEKQNFSNISEGDTPLHIAVRNKKLPMVDSLLRIPGINKDAVNTEGLTALDIARENTEYHEPYTIIERLGNFPYKGRPFMYSAPKVSAQKLETTRNMINTVFEIRHNTELVVAVLLATIAFTAAFTIPGGFKTEVEKGEEHKLGTPLLLRSISFKMFIIFDCTAFFLSLYVVLAWQLTMPLTTEHRLSFMHITNLMVCFTSAFITYGFMAAVYTMLAQNKLAWAVLGACLIITFCGFLGLFYLLTAFLLKTVRLKHLCGEDPIFSDRLVEYLWMKLEGQGFMELMRRCKTKLFFFASLPLL